MAMETGQQESAKVLETRETRTVNQQQVEPKESSVGRTPPHDENNHNATTTAVLLSDPSRGITLRASSVLQKNSKLYSPMNVLDDDAGTSWNSEGNQPTPTSLLLDFNRPVHPTTVKFQFQAGFAAESCTIFVDGKNSGCESLELKDSHELQEHRVTLPPQTNKMKLVLEDLTDFYGRVILYRLEVWGQEN